MFVFQLAQQNQQPQQEVSIRSIWRNDIRIQDVIQNSLPLLNTDAYRSIQQALYAVYNADTTRVTGTSGDVRAAATEALRLLTNNAFTHAQNRIENVPTQHQRITLRNDLERFLNGDRLRELGRSNQLVIGQIETILQNVRLPDNHAQQVLNAVRTYTQTQQPTSESLSTYALCQTAIDALRRINNPNIIDKIENAVVQLIRLRSPMSPVPVRTTIQPQPASTQIPAQTNSNQTTIQSIQRIFEATLLPARERAHIMTTLNNTARMLQGAEFQQVSQGEQSQRLITATIEELTRRGQRHHGPETAASISVTIQELGRMSNRAVLVPQRVESVGRVQRVPIPNAPQSIHDIETQRRQLLSSRHFQPIREILTNASLTEMQRVEQALARITTSEFSRILNATERREVAPLLGDLQRLMHSFRLLGY